MKIFNNIFPTVDILFREYAFFRTRIDLYLVIKFILLVVFWIIFSFVLGVLFTLFVRKYVTKIITLMNDASVE